MSEGSRRVRTDCRLSRGLLTIMGPRQRGARRTEVVRSTARTADRKDPAWHDPAFSRWRPASGNGSTRAHEDIDADRVAPGRVPSPKLLAELE